MTDSLNEYDTYIEIFHNSIKSEKPLKVSCSKVTSAQGTYLKFSAVFHLKKDCNCLMKVKTSVDDPSSSHPYSLKIELSNVEFQTEIKPCINYLQRQRNPDLALCLLESALILYHDRKSILNMLTSKYGELLTISLNDDNRVHMECTHGDKLYFKSNWLISFDCYIGSPFDSVDFIVTTSDADFYECVATYMKLLAQVLLPIEKKTKFWKNIMEEVLKSIISKTENEISDIKDSTISIMGHLIRNSTDEQNCNNNSNNPIPIIDLESSDSGDDSILVVE